MFVKEDNQPQVLAPAAAVSELTNGGLESEIATVGAHLAAGMSRWLELVAEFDRREGFYEHGNVSTAEWLCWRCGIAPRAAREHVRVARRLADLPLIAASFACGELSYSKVRALTRVASERTESDLLDMALGASASQLERICGALRGALSVDDARLAHERRHFGFSWEDDGSFSFRGRLSGEEGALVLKALELSSCLLHESSQESSAATISRADALVAMAESMLANGSAGSRAAERHQVIVHVDRAALADGDGGSAEPHDDGFAEPRSRIDGGPPIARETARRLACDAAVVELHSRAGEPLSVGRSRRTIPPSIRRALSARDGACRFPGCSNRLFVDAHHIRHWADGGETSLDNLVLLCRRHHRLLHEEGYSVVRSDDGSVRFLRPDGRVIADAPAVPRSHPGQIVTSNRARGIDPGADAGRARYRGDRLDLDLAVAGLCESEARAGPAP